eukprot:1069031-Pleurochrysis_carterae.AAC.1
MRRARQAAQGHAVDRRRRVLVLVNGGMVELLEAGRMAYCSCLTVGPEAAAATRLLWRLRKHVLRPCVVWNKGLI